MLEFRNRSFRLVGVSAPPTGMLRPEIRAQPILSVVDVRDGRSDDFLFGPKNHGAGAVTHLHQIYQLARIFRSRSGSKNTEPVSDPTIAMGLASGLDSSPRAKSSALTKPVQAWRNSAKGP